MSKKNCSKCGKEFDCCTESMGCWCEGYRVSPDNLKRLEEKYDNCLCEECLKGYGESHPAGDHPQGGKVEIRS